MVGVDQIPGQLPDLLAGAQLADTIGYLSMDGLLSSVNGKGAPYCTSCYTGQYPVAFPRDQNGYLQLSLKINGQPEPLPEEEPETVG